MVFGEVFQEEAEPVEGIGGQEMGIVDDGDDDFAFGVETASFGDEVQRIRVAAKSASNRVTCGKIDPINAHENNFRSSERYWMASRMSFARMSGAPARSASLWGQSPQ